MKKIALFTFLTLLLCTSCVTKKKFMMTEAARIASIDSLQSLLTDCRNTCGFCHHELLLRYT